MPHPDAITALGHQLLDDLPPRVREDPDIKAVVHCYAKESERQQEMAERVRDNLMVRRIDELGIPWWERLYKLPDPGGMNTEERRSRVVARAARTAPRVSAGEFVEDMNALVGSGSWSYEEEYPAIRVATAFAPGSEAYLRLEAQIRGLTSFPAHLDIILESAEGFILDQSQLDQDVFHPE